MGVWKPYPSEVTDQLEKEFLSDLPGHVSFVAAGNRQSYEVDLKTMKQVNTVTRVERLVRRRIIPVTDTIALPGAQPAYWGAPTSSSATFDLEHLSDDHELMRKLNRCLQPGDNAQLGKGLDASGWSSTTPDNEKRIRLRRAWRVQSSVRWQEYNASAEQIKLDMQHVPEALRRPFDSSRPAPLQGTVVSRWDPEEFSAAIKEMPGELRQDINEMYLMSGCPKDTTFKIASSGMNERFAGANLGSLFGEGIYFAEDGAKCDQYTREPDHRPVSSSSIVEAIVGGTNNSEMDALHQVLYPGGVGGAHPEGKGVNYIFMCRVILGCTVRTVDGWRSIDDGVIKGFDSLESPGHVSSGLWATRARRELGDIAGATRPIPFHSLLAELGGRVDRFREVVVFNGARVYPEYLLAYSREDAREAVRTEAWDTTDF